MFEFTSSNPTLYSAKQLLAVSRVRPILAAATILSIIGIAYWGGIASDRYVSEARVIIQRTDLATGQNIDFSTLLSGANAGSRADQLLLRDHLRSVDMLKKAEDQLKLRTHYSNWNRDLLSRMWFEDAPLEKFHQHYLSRVSIEYDDYSGVIIIKSQAYDARTAYALTDLLVKEGERFMNSMAHNLANDQVRFLQIQVEHLGARAMQARQAVLEYQNKKGLVSPQGTAENMAAIIARLETQLAELQTRRSSLLGYLMPDSPNVIDLNLQIAAVEKQINQEKARLASPAGQTLNRTVEEFQRLQMASQFADDIYRTALAALEKGRIEATRTLKKVSILQSPTQPEHAMEPRRLYNIGVFILAVFVLAGIVHLLVAIVRDHKD